MTWDEFYESMEAYVKAMNESRFHTTKKYNLTHIFDEDKSVRWNREEVERRNTECEEKRQIIKDKQNNAKWDFERAAIKYICEELKMDEDHAQKIFDHCYAEKHYAIKEVFDYINTLVEVLQ